MPRRARKLFRECPVFPDRLCGSSPLRLYRAAWIPRQSYSSYFLRSHYHMSLTDFILIKQLLPSKSLPHEKFIKQTWRKSPAPKARAVKNTTRNRLLGKRYIPHKGENGAQRSTSLKTAHAGFSPRGSAAPSHLSAKGSFMLPHRQHPYLSAKGCFIRRGNLSRLRSLTLARHMRAYLCKRTFAASRASAPDKCRARTARRGGTARSAAHAGPAGP